MGCAEVVVTPSWGGGGPPVASSEASEVPPTGIPEERRTRDSCQGPKVCPEQDRMRHSCGETSVVGGHLGEAVGQVQTQEGGPHWAGRRVRNTQRVSAWLSLREMVRRKARVGYTLAGLCPASVGRRRPIPRAPC